MTRKWNELNHKATAEQMDKARADLRRELTLHELRRAQGMTQHQLAQALDTTQPGISRIERQTDLYLSTLRSYVNALGGELELRAWFPDAGEIVLGGFGDLERKNIEIERSEEDVIPA